MIKSIKRLYKKNRILIAMLGFMGWPANYIINLIKQSGWEKVLDALLKNDLWNSFLLAWFMASPFLASIILKSIVNELENKIRSNYADSVKLTNHLKSISGNLDELEGLKNKTIRLCDNVEVLIETVQIADKKYSNLLEKIEIEGYDGSGDGDGFGYGDGDDAGTQPND